LNIPWGLYIDWSNTLLISDTGNNRIQRYVKDASFGETVAGRTSGNIGNKSNELHYPRDISVDSDNNLYISDSGNHRIQLWTQGSSNGTTIAGATGMLICILNSFPFMYLKAYRVVYPIGLILLVESFLIPSETESIFVIMAITA